MTVCDFANWMFAVEFHTVLQLEHSYMAQEGQSVKNELYLEHVLLDRLDPYVIDKLIRNGKGK